MYQGKNNTLHSPHKKNLVQFVTLAGSLDYLILGSSVVGMLHLLSSWWSCCHHTLCPRWSKE